MSANDSLDFEDGDIVLALAKRKFRVHSSVLVSKSPVFADMLSKPLPPKSPAFGRLASGRPASMRFNFESLEKQMKYESLPVVQLHDKSEPFTLFLHAFYNDDLQIYFPKLAQNTTFLISGVMDLVEKYQVSQTEMRTKFFPFIEQDWPSTLAGWDENETHVKQLRDELIHSSQLDMLDNKLPEPASVLRFTHAYTLKEKRVQDIPSYLPAAFYHLSRLPPFADPDNDTYPDGEPDGSVRTAKRSFLSHQDFICLHHGIYNLHLASSRIGFIGFLKEAEDYPHAQDAEKKAMIQWWRIYGMERLIGPERTDVLMGLKELIESLGEHTTGDREVGILHQETGAPYRDAMRNYLTKERKEVWANLGQYFSLHSFFDR